MSKFNATAVRNAIVSAMYAKGAGNVISWGEIMAAVTGAGITVRNWVHVRCVVQQLFTGLLVRTSDLTVEEYSIVALPA